jgi:hypothetical protein
MIIFVHGDKGGVGKSQVAMTLTDYLLTRGQSVRPIDTDTRNPDYARMFNGLNVDLTTHEGYLDLMDVVAESDEKYLVISLPAGVGAKLETELEQFAPAMKDIGRDMALLFVINRQSDSIVLLQKALDQFAKHTDKYAVVKNLFFGKPESFVRWNDSKTRQTFLQQGGMEINLPELHERVLDPILANPGVSFSDAPGKIKLRYSDTVVLKTYLSESAREFDKLGWFL